MLTVVTSVSASAQNFTYEGLKCELRNGLNGYYVEIEGLEGDCPSVLEIPSEVVYDGITYPVTSIGDYAFEGCSSLTSVTIPDSVTEIGKYAFDCGSLTSVYISDLEAWCNIEFEGIYSNPLINNASLYLNGELVTDVIFPDSLTTIKPFAFEGCSSLTSVTIPNSVTEIGAGAFSNCTNLPSVTIPNSVTEIGEYAFKGCSSLTSITIPNSVTEIRAWTFGCCDNLTSVTIPASVTKIGESAFSWCIGLTYVYISDLEAWCNIEFHYTSNTLIGWASLYLNGELVTDLIIPESVTTIKPYTFYDCSGLTSVTIHNSVTEIGEGAFGYCYDLSCLTIPDSVTKIGEGAFSSCHGLTSLTIGESISEIGITAFQFCDKLSIINIRAKTPPAIVRYADIVYSRENPFEDVVYEKATLYVPAGCGEAYKAAQGWSNFNNIVEGEFSGIDEVETEVSENGIVGYYNAQGAMSNEPWQGLNIVVYGDGSHRKVIF